MKSTSATICLVVLLALAGACPARAQTARTTLAPSPSPSPGAGSNRSTSPAVIIVFAALAGAALWQLQKSRRSAQEYARSATSHFERSLEADKHEHVREEEPDREQDDPG